MKREGRQHGVVRSFAVLPAPLSNRRYVKTVDSSSVTGVFTKVSTKPTNHSKFTGKCSTARCMGCHIHPASKSKDKAKGTMKLRSIGFDHELVCCQPGASATRAFGYLVNEESYDDGDEYEYEYGDGVGVGVGGIVKEEHIEDECVSYCDVGLCWGEGGEGEDEWYLVGHFE
ncbi:hypothetical protein HanXRQr2_Chr07g0306961 [Helianthus annuus]|uniref:Uncharacterized protein n=1 Tax=Helianthus annuus TaxID=4232 RepID=A0A9K3NH77_HELAN|nr:hypothetical protein HanXRQr2_Chr07g0306961 [Helianthus annuus]